MTNKEKYKVLCETEGSRIPLFQQYWWMTAVSEGKTWDVLLSEEHGTICGAMPFLYGKKFGLKFILQPQLTPWSGPWVNPDMDEATQKQTLANLAAALRAQKPALCIQRFAPGMNQWQPFEHQGFTPRERYTYRFDPIPDPSTLVDLADRGRRRNTEVVKKTYTLDRQVDATEFAHLHAAYWEGRSGHDLLSQQFIIRVCSAAIERGQALLYGLRRDDGTLMAARFAVFDDKCAYALMSGRRPESLRNCMSVLVWSMLTDLYGHTKSFDFEGGTAPGVGHFYSSFGSTQTPYWEFSRFRPRVLKYFVH